MIGQKALRGWRNTAPPPAMPSRHAAEDQYLALGKAMAEKLATRLVGGGMVAADWSKFGRHGL